MQIADTITELKLGNGTSVLIFANIASALPTSVGAALTQAASKDSANVAIYAGAFFLTTLGIVYVQEAERKIPMNYASRYRNSALSRQSYLPFKVPCCAVLCCAALCCAGLCGAVLCKAVQCCTLFACIHYVSRLLQESHVLAVGGDTIDVTIAIAVIVILHNSGAGAAANH